ncbi:MAG TPA: protein translocase subunit SecF [Candidatus Methylomirabilis sp.]|nr:protein translocase subunit SecF [Candidatus Methylomirabilis sp.]
MRIIQKRKIWFSIAIVLAVASIVALAMWQLKFGIDFTGGSLQELNFSANRPSVTDVQDKLADLNLGGLVVQPVGDQGMILRFQNTSGDVHKKVLEKLGTSTVEELRFDSIGPSIGAELKKKTFYAIVISIIIILIYIAFAFRKVSRPVESWKYGLCSVIALAFNVLVVLGVFSALGKFANMEINAPFIAALLTILGYTINDTIVVFDRVRENLPKSDLDFEGTVNASINQTLVRSVNTSSTVILVLIAIFLFGGASIRDFTLAMAVGVFVGTWSSIFLASPLLLLFEKKS